MRTEMTALISGFLLAVGGAARASAAPMTTPSRAGRGAAAPVAAPPIIQIDPSVSAIAPIDAPVGPAETFQAEHPGSRHARENVEMLNLLLTRAGQESLSGEQQALLSRQLLAQGGNLSDPLAVFKLTDLHPAALALPPSQVTASGAADSISKEAKPGAGGDADFSSLLKRLGPSRPVIEKLIAEARGASTPSASKRNSAFDGSGASPREASPAREKPRSMAATKPPFDRYEDLGAMYARFPNWETESLTWRELREAFPGPAEAGRYLAAVFDMGWIEDPDPSTKRYENLIALVLQAFETAEPAMGTDSPLLGVMDWVEENMSQLHRRIDSRLRPQHVYAWQKLRGIRFEVMERASGK